ncbi:MAG: chromosomal replication initiator protein DnaA [Desulfuromonadaceae bacterium]
MNRLWQETLSHLEKKLNDQNFSTWIKPIKFKNINKDIINLEVPNRFILDWVKENYISLIKETISEIGAVSYKVSLSVPDDLTPQKEYSSADQITDNATTVESSKTIEKSKLNNNINEKYTFEDFVSGSSNQFAYAAAMAVANNPATTYNPLFIYGGVGLGKTHIINAIGNAITKRDKSLRVCYYSSEKFMNELINSLRYAKMDEFRRKFRSMDVLLIDDVQFIAGKERTQEEFFHTFNALYESHKQIVVTSDKFPKDIPGLEERLRSRFEWGLIADIQPPDVETKLAILKMKADHNSIFLPQDVALFLANSVSSNVRELEGYLIRIGAYASLTSTAISLSMAKEVLKDILIEKNREITIDEIQKGVSAHFNIKVSDLKSAKRLKTLVTPRQIAMYISRQIEKQMEADYQLKMTIDNLKNSFSS